MSSSYRGAFVYLRVSSQEQSTDNQLPGLEARAKRPSDRIEKGRTTVIVRWCELMKVNKKQL